MLDRDKPIDPEKKPAGPQDIVDVEFPTEEELEQQDIYRAGGAAIQDLLRGTQDLNRIISNTINKLGQIY